MRAHGIDISKWQTSFMPPSNSPHPIDFCIQRTSYGLMPDEKLSELWEGVKEVPIRGAYHYFSSAVNWLEQAKFFLKLSEKYNYHFLALDIEVYFNNKSEGFWWGAKRFVDWIIEATGKKVLLYTNPNVYKTWFLPYGDWMKDYDLWLAQYWFNPKPIKNPGMNKMGRDDWKFYQYTDKGKGSDYGVMSGGVDLNVFNGELRELNAWLTIRDESGNKPIDEPQITEESVLDSILNEVVETDNKTFEEKKMSIENELKRIADALEERNKLGGLPIAKETASDPVGHTTNSGFAKIKGAILVKLNTRTSVQYEEFRNDQDKPVLNTFMSPKGNAYVVNPGDVYQVWEKKVRVDGGRDVYLIIGSEGDTIFRDKYFYLEDVDKL